MTFYTHRQNSSSQSGATRAAHAPGGHIASAALFVLATALGTAAVLLASPAWAQTPVAASAPAAAAAPAGPGYTVAQIAQAFGFIDGNKDGKLSREEAAGFRGVARHFDEADTNKDGALSREEFEHALSVSKSR